LSTANIHHASIGGSIGGGVASGCFEMAVIVLEGLTYSLAELQEALGKVDRGSLTYDGQELSRVRERLLYSPT